jgi:hypothetical protein
MTATPQNAALDTDFVAYKLGAFFPSGAIDNLPPEITDIQPPQNALFHAVGTGVSFTASTMANNSLPEAGIKLTLNGQDVSSALAISGTAANRTVKFSGLQANTLYRGELVVADQAGRAATNKLVFDTFIEADSVVVEAEDYNFSSGQFLENAGAGAILEQIGTPDVDYFDTTLVPGGAADHIYRSLDGVSTRNSPDVPRQQFIDALLVEAQVSLVQTNEWLNYTRTIPNARYNAYLRASSTAPQRVRLDRVTGDVTQANQTVASLGTFQVPVTGNANAFVYTPLTDAQGAMSVLELSGLQTLRLTALDANNTLNLNFLILVKAPAVTAPQSVTLTGARVAAGSISFTFVATAGRSYRVEYRNSLDAGSWTLLTAINNASAGTQTATDTATAQAQRFYRVVSQ